MHHWDENGLFANETVNTPGEELPPLPVRDTQSEELAFVLEWMEEWKLSRMGLDLRSQKGDGN